MARSFSQIVGKGIRSGGRTIMGQNAPKQPHQGDQAMTMDANGTPQPAMSQQAPEPAAPSMSGRPPISDVGDPSFDVPSGLSFTSPEPEVASQAPQHGFDPFG